MPVHNSEQTLPTCLDSIAAQSLTDWELIVVDDGSTDDTPAILARYAEKDSRITVLSPGRIGLVPAINRGNENASSKCIARMDADDIMHPDRLRLQAAYLDSHPEISVVAAQVRLFPENCIEAGYREYIQWQNSCLTPDDIANNIYVESPIANPSVMVRAEVYQTHGLYRDGLFPEDYEFWLRITTAGLKIGKLREVLLDWRESPGRATRTDPRFSRDAFNNIRADYLFRDSRLHTGRPVVIWGAGRRTRQRGKLIQNRGIGISAYIDVDPNKIGQIIDDTPVHDSSWLRQTPRPFVLVYVTNHGARELISAKLHAFGYQCGVDYLAVG